MEGRGRKGGLGNIMVEDLSFGVFEQITSQLGGSVIHITKILQRLALGVVLASVPLMGGCGEGNTLTWQEEVKLLDGRVITVTQKRRYETVYTGHNVGKLPREFWLTFKLPELGDKEITWHENLKPHVLNVHQGRLYVIGLPFTEREFRQYGKPKPSYLGYRYEAGRWLPITFSEIPEIIYRTNLLIANEPPNSAKFVSADSKVAEMKDDSLGDALKRIDPNWNMLNY